MPLVIRLATPAEIEPVRALQVTAMRTLGAGYSTPLEIEAAVRYVCVPDRGTYLIAGLDGQLVGCGGWSLRRKQGRTGPWGSPPSRSKTSSSASSATPVRIGTRRRRSPCI